MNKKYYILARRALTKLHVHAFLDRVLTQISKHLPLCLLRYNDVKLSFGSYTLVVIEDVEKYHRLVKPERGWVIIDGGAHVGVYTIEVAKTVGEKGKVISIEPDDSVRIRGFIAKEIPYNCLGREITVP